MAADTDTIAPKRVYITKDETPPPPLGFTIDSSAPPVAPPPPDAVPKGPGNYTTPDPPPGYVIDGSEQAPTEGSLQPMPSDFVVGGHRSQEGETPLFPDATTHGARSITQEGIDQAISIAMSAGPGTIHRTGVVSPPPPAGYVLDGSAQALADDLHTLRQSSVADKAEIGNKIQALPPEAKNPAIGEKLYHAAEDPAEYAKLTPEEKALSDQHLDPLRQEQFDLAIEAKKLGGDNIVDDPNYMHRIAKGHAPQYDSISGSSLDPVTGTRGLPRTTSALQERKFYAIESPSGVRKIITPNDNGITVWNNKVGTSIPTSAEIKPGEVVDINGTNWGITHARTKEIEQHGLFKGPKPAEYHKNAFVNTADAIVHLREVVRNLKFIKEVKASQWWLQHAQSLRGNAKPPEGWVRPKMPQFNDWYVDPKIAHVLDDFYKPGLLGDVPAAQVLREINQFATSSIFWNPIPHAQNVGVHWAVARGFDWLRPRVMRHFATDMTRALKATVTQNADYQHFLRQGGGLVYGGVKNADFYGDLGRHMGMQIEKNWSQYAPLFKKLGLTKPAQAIAWWYSKMRNVLWATSDTFMMHRYLELKRKGYSDARAIRDAEKHIPNYRIPAEIGTKVLGQRGGRLASMTLQEPAITNFARYHYGMWNSFMHMATDLAKGTPAEKKEALGNVAALAFMGYVVYPVLDALYQKVTGDPNAKLLRRGAMSVPHGLAEVSRDRESFSQFLQSNITMAPATKELITQLFGKDLFTGRDLGGAVGRAEHGAEAVVSPYGTAAQLYRGGEGARGAGRTALDTVVGGENTSEKSEKGKQYGANLRKAATTRHRRTPQGPIEGAYYGAEKVLGLAPEEAPKKEKAAKEPKAKRSHHNKEKRY